MSDTESVVELKRLILHQATQIKILLSVSTVALALSCYVWVHSPEGPLSGPAAVVASKPAGSITTKSLTIVDSQGREVVQLDGYGISLTNSSISVVGKSGDGSIYISPFRNISIRGSGFNPSVTTLDETGMNIRNSPDDPSQDLPDPTMRLSSQYIAFVDRVGSKGNPERTYLSALGSTMITLKNNNDLHPGIQLHRTFRGDDGSHINSHVIVTDKGVNRVPLTRVTIDKDGYETAVDEK